MGLLLDTGSLLVLKLLYLFTTSLLAVWLLAGVAAMLQHVVGHSVRLMFSKVSYKQLFPQTSNGLHGLALQMTGDISHIHCESGLLRNKYPL